MRLALAGVLMEFEPGSTHSSGSSLSSGRLSSTDTLLGLLVAKFLRRHVGAFIIRQEMVIYTVDLVCVLAKFR
jgi:hypothetical protein